MMQPDLAIILAAGEGRRLRPLTGNRPKCLVPVGRSCFLERTLSALARFHFEKVCVLAGSFADQVAIFSKNFFSLNRLHLCCNPDYRETNNAYSLWRSLTAHSRCSFLLLDGDLLFEQLLLERLLQDSRKDLLVVETDRKKVTEESMKVIADPGKTIRGIGKGIDLRDADGEFIGMAKFSAAWSDLICQELERKCESGSYRDSYYEDVIQALLPKGPPLSLLQTDGLRWAEIDTLEDLKRFAPLW